MREKIVVNNIYHIVSRGVDKRDIFLNDKDYFRFIHDLFEFNNTESSNNNFYLFNHLNFTNDVRHRYIKIETEKKKRKLLVKVLAFCLMLNHYHLLLMPLFEDGISKFMKKINGGYAKYFNKKHQRSGALFESRYKLIPVNQDSHLLHLPYYIHSNPLDIKFPEWRNKEIKDYKEAMKFLESYRWSSFPDYIGIKNFPSVTQREFLNNFLGGPTQYKKDTLRWLKEMDLEEIEDIVLE